jgi:hypothetical protein
MSARDIEFISHLSLCGADIARILSISRQSVSRGLRGEKDYFDKRKLVTISEAAERLFDLDSNLIKTLVEKLYPHCTSEVRRIAASDAVNLSIDGDLYFSCTRLPYYMSVYRKLFFDLSQYIKVSNHRLFFAFPDRDTMRYSRGKLLTWVKDRQALGNAFVIVCPALAIFPFSVCGTNNNKPVVYFCDDEGFVPQNENNSRLIVNFIQQYIENHSKLIKRLDGGP